MLGSESKNLRNVPRHTQYTPTIVDAEKHKNKYVYTRYQANDSSLIYTADNIVE